MKPLFVLIGTFALSLLFLRLSHRPMDYRWAGRLAMAVMLFFTAMGHFVFTKGMAAMIPDFLPYRIETVYLTGVLEALFAIGLLLPAYRLPIAWILGVFFVLLLPANIKAAMENVDYRTGDLNGPGLSYLWFRVPLQVFFIIWVYFSAVRE